MRIVVIGAGATGLSAAYLLARNGADVTLLDSADEPGGLLATFDVGTRRLERFYHHCFTHDAELMWLLTELGLRDRLFFSPATMGIVRDGRARPFSGLRDVLAFGPLSIGSRLRFVASSAWLAFSTSLVRAERVAAAAWLRRWAGAAATETIWRPLLRAKFGAAAEQVPLAWMAGRLRQRARSRGAGRGQLGYLDGSLQLLVDRIVTDLRQRSAVVKLGSPVLGLLAKRGAVRGVETPDGPIEADAVLSTIPSPHLSQLLADPFPDYSRRLAEIRYMGVVCTVLTLRESLSPVYWLNVADPGCDFVGVIEHTRLVPPSHYGDRHIVYLPQYVHWSDPLWTTDDDELLGRQLGQLTRLFGTAVEQSLARSWVFRARCAAHVPELDFGRRIPRLRTPIPGLFAASMCHIYPDERSVNNSIRVAADAVGAMGFDIRSVPRGLSLAGTYGK